MLRAHGTYGALTFTDDDLTGMGLTDVGFTDCSHSALNVHELELSSARITDSRLHHLDIPTVSAAYIELRGVVLEDSRLGVLQCIEGSWNCVHIRNAKIGYVSLRGATINQFQQLAPAMAARLGIDVER
ncbi:UNVERIFIED_CONTAM: hypothetical protein RF653_05255 [Kocuria sp. CPCC 205316]|uniref:hypothetical protein n=1 Tax=Kocuria TaxID=57493 RepID=UPI0036DE45FC